MARISRSTDRAEPATAEPAAVEPGSRGRRRKAPESAGDISSGDAAEPDHQVSSGPAPAATPAGGAPGEDGDSEGGRVGDRMGNGSGDRDNDGAAGDDGREKGGSGEDGSDDIAAELSFREAQTALELSLAQLQGPDLDVEAMAGLYRRACRYADRCEQLLHSVEQEVMRWDPQSPEQPPSPFTL